MKFGCSQDSEKVKRLITPFLRSIRLAVVLVFTNVHYNSLQFTTVHYNSLQFTAVVQVFTTGLQLSFGILYIHILKVFGHESVMSSGERFHFPSSRKKEKTKLDKRKEKLGQKKNTFKSVMSSGGRFHFPP